MSGAGYVYLLRHGDTRWYKIGRTVQTPGKRQKGLTTGNPEGLTVVQTWFCETRHGDFESYLHALFSQYHMSGRAATEFFDFTDAYTEPELLSLIGAEHDKFIVDLLEEDPESIPQTSTEYKPSNEQVQALLDERRALAASVKLAEIRMKTIDLLLKEYISSAAGLQDANGRQAISWTTQQRNVLDTVSLRAVHPELAFAFSKSIESRVFRIL